MEYRGGSRRHLCRHLAVHPGKWRIVYDEWEYFNILEGHSILTEDGGAPRDLKPGDRVILRPGFAGTWEVVETTRSDYVIRL